LCDPISKWKNSRPLFVWSPNYQRLRAKHPRMKAVRLTHPKPLLVI
jgi:hypothetical protein